MPGGLELITLLSITSAFAFSVLLVIRDFAGLKYLSGTAFVRGRRFPVRVLVMLTQSVLMICFFFRLESG